LELPVLLLGGDCLLHLAESVNRPGDRQLGYRTIAGELEIRLGSPRDRSRVTGFAPTPGFYPFMWFNCRTIRMDWRLLRQRK
jgi:hypothetical protein